MATLTRWEPFREMMTLRNNLDQVFQNAFQSMDEQSQRNGSAYALALDVSESEDEFLVKAAVPGIQPDDLEITLNNHVLTINGEFKDETQSENVRYHLRERHYGTFSRSITLPSAVNEDEINAQFEHGMLMIHIPKAEQAKPKRISVQAQNTISGKTS